MDTRSLQRIILVFVILLEIPVPTTAVERPAGWKDDGIYKGEDKFSSGLRCYDCLDCDEPFSYEYRNCFSAISCYIVRAKLMLNGYTEKDYYKAHLPRKEYKLWVKTWYERKLTIRGCSDYGFNCPDVVEKHEEEGNFKAPFHMMEVIECEECKTDFCNIKKTNDHPIADRATLLATAEATSISAKDYIPDALILYGIVQIINALWCV